MTLTATNPHDRLEMDPTGRSGAAAQQPPPRRDLRGRDVPHGDRQGRATGDDAANAGLLREIQEEHGRAAQGIRDRIRELGGEPSDSSGAWGAWAKTVQGTDEPLRRRRGPEEPQGRRRARAEGLPGGLDDIDATRRS